MKNLLNLFKSKTRNFWNNVATKKDTMMGAIMVFALASIAAIFFLILDQILRFFKSSFNN